ncbi:MAG: flagellar filament outer layer protein FlaA [Treponema sp.]|jgi:hypothetical protein|nr:flagellar filament outer layer protein FlaA [Treponema sp.]
MKHGSFKALSFALCLILMAGMAGSTAFGDENTVDLVSITVEDFGGDTHHEWTIGSRTYSYDFSWKVDASKFASVIDDQNYPRMNYVNAFPQVLYGSNPQREILSLGIWGKFDRRGYNWIDLYPVGDDGEAFEIPLPGRIRDFDAWIWGANHNFYVEIYLRDYRGVVHSVYLGSLAYQGWRNLRVRLPTNIPQSRPILPYLAGLSFVKFRIWTTPTAAVDNFYIYIDHFKVLTDVFESLFDGSDLANPDRVQELWSSGR